MELSDRTKIDGTPWQMFKKEAMKEGFKSTYDYQRLTAAEKKLCQRLIEAQTKQGDNKELIVMEDE